MACGALLRRRPLRERRVRRTHEYACFVRSRAGKFGPAPVDAERHKPNTRQEPASSFRIRSRSVRWSNPTNSVVHRRKSLVKAW